MTSARATNFQRAAAFHQSTNSAPIFRQRPFDLANVGERNRSDSDTKKQRVELCNFPNAELELMRDL